MGAVIAAADRTIVNKGTLTQLKTEIRRVMKEMLEDE